MLPDKELISCSLDKKDAELFEKEGFPKVEQIVKPYLNTPIVVRLYELETTLCRHFVEALAA